MKIYVKYMVSLRCKLLVRSELERLEIGYSTIDLGEIQLTKPVSSAALEHLKVALSRFGLELLDDKKAILIEKIKSVVIEMIHEADQLTSGKKSVHISEKLKYDYTYLSTIFSEATGMTLEQYIIFHKIEKVKELILYNELNLSEISYKLNYSSLAHLSAQFKKITGLTPTFFKKLADKKRKNIEDI
jgi:AraC-like DNA-binding protein